MPKVRSSVLTLAAQHGLGGDEAEGTRLSYVADGSVHSNADAPLATRLFQIHTQLVEILQRYVQMRQLSKNLREQGCARHFETRAGGGAAMLAPALAGINVAEYAPTLLKNPLLVRPRGEGPSQAYGQGAAAAS